MKSLMYTAPEELRIQEAEMPQGSCVIRVLACAICGTDLKTYLHGHPYFKPPVILGHEAIGEVVKIPDGYTLCAGDYVAIAPYGECGKCERCRAGYGELCKQKNYIETGSFCEYVEVPENFIEDGLYKIDEPDLAFTLVEPLACVLLALDQLTFHSGSRALVVGGGPMGALLALALQSMDKEVAVVEINPKRVQYLRAWDIDSFDSPDADLGYRDNILIAVNKPELVPLYIDKVSAGGLVHLFSGMPSGTKLEVDAHAIHYRKVTLTGSSGFALPHFRRALVMIQTSPDHFRRLLTHTLPLEEGEKAFRLFESGSAFKILLKP